MPPGATTSLPPVHAVAVPMPPICALPICAPSILVPLAHGLPPRKVAPFPPDYKIKKGLHTPLHITGTNVRHKADK